MVRGAAVFALLAGLAFATGVPPVFAGAAEVPFAPAAASKSDAPSDLPPLRWAADAEGGAPYIFKDPNDINRYVGFEVELAAALGKELGRHIEFVQYDFKSLTSGLQRGDFDFAMNGVEDTPDRRKALRLSRPYYVYTLQLVVRKDESRFESLEQCKELHGVVGTLEDTAAERLLDKMGITKRVYGNQVEPYTDLKLNRLDAVLLDLPIATSYAQPDEKLKFVGPPIAPGNYVIAFRKDQEPLAAEFDAALERLAEKGELRRIYEKWNIWNEHQERLFAKEGVSNDVVHEAGRLWTLRHYLPTLLQGALVTVELTFTSMFLAMALGLPIALLRLYGPAPLRWSAMVYVEFFRGIPCSCYSISSTTGCR